MYRTYRVAGRLIAGFVLFATAALPQEKRPRIDVEHYQIEAEIDPAGQTLRATAAVKFSSVEETITSAVFELNNTLQLTRVTDGSGQALNHSRNLQDFTVRVTFGQPLAKGASSTIVFTYDGRLAGSPDESPVYGVKFASIQTDYSYLLYPARWFPISEYTADRAATTLRITVPNGFRVLAPGLETKAAAGAKMTWTFENTRPGFPGSIAVVKGDGARISSEGVTTFVHFRGDSAEMARPYGEETGKLMVWLTSLYGLPPIANLTLIETENGAPTGYSVPGLVFLNPRTIGKSVNSRVLVNNISRQWWGNSISAATRNHLWITNGAARYSEMLWVEQNQGANALETELRDTYVEALTVSDPPMIQASRLDDYAPEFWAVTGAKGAAVYGMLRHAIGDEAFKKLLKGFREANAGKSVNTEDFRKAAEAASGRDLRGFFIQWIESTGAPEFKLEYTVFRTQKGFRIMGKIAQDLDTFRMPIDLLIETEGNPETKQVEVVGTSSEFVVETFGRPKKVTADPNYRVLRFSNQMRVAVAIRRGEMFAEISEFGDALKEYQKALDVNRNSSLAHYRVAEVFFLQGNYQAAANEFRESLNGDLEPKWVEVWAHINLGKIFDITAQRERAQNEYNQAIRTKDNTQGAQEEAAKYLKQPYERPAQTN